MNLGEMIERIANDLQCAGEDPSYGVGAVDPAFPATGGTQWPPMKFS